MPVSLFVDAERGWKGSWAITQDVERRTMSSESVSKCSRRVAERSRRKRKADPHSVKVLAH